MNILLYYQNQYRTVFLESLVQSFIQKGNKVYFLTTCKKGILHQQMEDLGAKVDTYYKPNANKLFQYFDHWQFLIKYCRKNKIGVVYSHLQFVNLIAVFAQYFISSKVFPCRHHSNDSMLTGNKNALILDKLINKFAKKIIVVSNSVKQQMVNYENTKAEKIVVIPLGYNFDLYDKPDLAEMAKMRLKMKCHLLMIVIGRMTVNKRHIVALNVLKRMVTEGYDIKLLILDQGQEEKNLRTYVTQNGLKEHALFTGFVNNTINHLAVSDLLIHPSISEASNQVVKEAAILGKPSIACKGVGDFEEYIQHKQNGFLVSKENTADEMCKIIKEYYHKKDELIWMGKNIRNKVLALFDIDKVGKQYLEISM